MHTIAGEDFEAVDKTIKLTKEDLRNIQTDPDRGDHIVSIPLTEDDYTEGAETFTLSLEAHPDVDVKADSATITITDSNKRMFSMRGCTSLIMYVQAILLEVILQAPFL